MDFCDIYAVKLTEKDDTDPNENKHMQIGGLKATVVQLFHD